MYIAARRYLPGVGRTELGCCSFVLTFGVRSQSFEKIQVCSPVESHFRFDWFFLNAHSLLSLGV
jgi:hypothetical protein